MLQHNVEKIPWHKVGVDLFELNGKDYLTAVDYFTNYPEVIQLNNTTSETVISCLKQIFTTHGIPRELITDNGPQFSSYLFKQFSQ